MHRSRLSILKSAIQLAILYFPLASLFDLIEAACPFADIYVQPLISAPLCFCVLFSDSAKTALKKWGCSILFSLAFWFILRETHFYVRLVNELHPGYGRLSAGAGFAYFAEWVVFAAVQGGANLFAVVFSRPLKAGTLQKLRFIVQDIILPVICIIIFLIVLYLELTMTTAW